MPTIVREPESDSAESPPSLQLYSDTATPQHLRVQQVTSAEHPGHPAARRTVLERDVQSALARRGHGVKRHVVHGQVDEPVLRGGDAPGAGPGGDGGGVAGTLDVASLSPDQVARPVASVLD